MGSRFRARLVRLVAIHSPSARASGRSEPDLDGSGRRVGIVPSRELESGFGRSHFEFVAPTRRCSSRRLGCLDRSSWTLTPAEDEPPLPWAVDSGPEVASSHGVEGTPRGTKPRSGRPLSGVWRLSRSWRSPVETHRI